MALNDIIFVKGQGGLGRPLPGEDFVSGLLIYTNTLPSGFSTNDRVKVVGSVEEAEQLGIVNTFAEATAATGSYAVTNAGAANDTVVIKVAELDLSGNPTTTTIATYTRETAQNTTALVAAGIGAAINQGTNEHGYSATVSGTTVTIIAPKRSGIFLNTGTPITVTITGTVAGTITQFTGGTISQLAIWHYHISEFFRLQPKGLLWVGFYAIPGTYTFEEIKTMQIASNGKIRQIGIYKNGAFASGNLTTIQTVCNELAVLHQPLSAIYAGDITAVTDISTLADLSTLTANNTSAVIGQDGGGTGNYLYKTTNKSITVLGAILGVVALSRVSDDIAWVGKYNMSNGFECDTLALANGTALKTLSQNQLNLLDDKRYIFLIKYVGISGSYVNDSHCAIALNSDYAYIENNRTIDKAIRGVYSSMLPNLNSPLLLNADGSLQDTTVAYFESQAAINLEQMVRDSELSAFDVIVNPVQPVLQTGNITVTVKLVPVGVARQITVNIGFTVSI